MAEEQGITAWAPAASGFLLGIVFLLLLDSLIPHMHLNNEKPEGIKSKLKKTTMLVLAVTLHNIPEGMAVSLPLRTEGTSRKKSFFYGQASGLVEPISGVIGAILVSVVRNILPILLCFASGAMIYVVAEELIPAGKTNEKNKCGTIGVILGFAIMMSLDIALG